MLICLSTFSKLPIVQTVKSVSLLKRKRSLVRMTFKSESLASTFLKHYLHISRGFWISMDYRCSNSASSISNSQTSFFFTFKFKSVTNIIIINQKLVIVIPFSFDPTFSSPCPPLLPNWSPHPLMLLLLSHF